MRMSSEWKGHKEWEKSETVWQKKVLEMTLAEVERTALRIERDAKLLVPVDTGELRRSLETGINKSTYSINAEIGTDVEYSEAVEFGTYKQRAQPYLIPSFDRNTKTLENTLSNILRG